jgi:hypothetical protein
MNGRLFAEEKLHPVDFALLTHIIARLVVPNNAHRDGREVALT